MVVLGLFLLVAAGGARFAHMVVEHGVLGAAPVVSCGDSSGHGHDDVGVRGGCGSHGRHDGHGHDDHDHDHDHGPSAPDDCDLCDLMAGSVTTVPEGGASVVGVAGMVVGPVLAPAEALVSRVLDGPRGRGPPVA